MNVRENLGVFLHQVAGELRRTHKMNRLSAEWLCFRMANTCEVNRKRGAKYCAELLFEFWLRTASIVSEFEALLAAYQHIPRMEHHAGRSAASVGRRAN